MDGIYGDAYYQGAERGIGFQDYAALRPARERMFARHLDRIEARMTRGQVLDVGCASGDFLQVARDRGWQVLGVDPSPAARQLASHGIPLVGRSLDDAQVEPHSVDLITFWDVLEHLRHPLDALRRAHTLLRAGGRIAVTVPDSGNLVARLSGRRWFGYKTAGEHLQFYTFASLTQALQSAGFQVEERMPVAWSCTLGFVADRAGLYLGPVGRSLKRLVTRTGLTRMIVDVPQVNQFGMAIALG